MNQARIHSHRWDQWNLILGHNQLEWKIIKPKRKTITKYHDAHQHLPKYFTDGSEREQEGSNGGYLVRKDGQLITSEQGN